jgi:hypothetical protein
MIPLYGIRQSNKCVQNGLSRIDKTAGYQALPHAISVLRQGLRGYQYWHTALGANGQQGIYLRGVDNPSQHTSKISLFMSAKRYYSNLTLTLMCFPSSSSVTLNLFKPLEPSGYYMYHQP